MSDPMKVPIVHKPSGEEVIVHGNRLTGGHVRNAETDEEIHGFRLLPDSGWWIELDGEKMKWDDFAAMFDPALDRPSGDVAVFVYGK